MNKKAFRPAILARRKRLDVPAQASDETAPEVAAAVVPIASVRPQARVAVQGMVRSPGTVMIAGDPAFRFTLVDGSGELAVVFPGQSEMSYLLPSTRITAEGTVRTHEGELTMWEPSITIESDF